MNKYLKQSNLKIDLGAGNPNQGEVQAVGYLLQDVEAHSGIDLVCDIRDLNKYLAPESCAVIRASHVLEHFGRTELANVLTMLFNLLRVGGELEIIVPNFRFHAQLLLQGDEETAERYAFGGQLDEWDYHKVGITPKILTKYLDTVGFGIKSMEETSCVIATAIKL